MIGAHRSACPINLTVELLGDRWTLIILRDIIFGDRRRFRELLNNSEEGIASNILADRLKRLQAEGLLTRAGDPDHKQKGIFSLTEKAIALVPIFAHLGAWGSKFLPVREQLAVRARLLEEGGPPLWEQFMTDLRVVHLGDVSRSSGPSVAERLQVAYEEACAVKRASSRGE